MKVSFSTIKNKIDNKTKQVIEKNVKEENPAIISKPASKLSQSALIAMFLLPVVSGFNSASSKSIESQDANTYAVENVVSADEVESYVNKSKPTVHTVKKGETVAIIAKKYNVSTIRVLRENNLDSKSLIHAGDKLSIPSSYKVKNISSSTDVAKALKVYTKFVTDLSNFEKIRSKIYKDRNGNKTIGIGHLVKSNELAKYQNVELNSKQIYTLLAQDLYDIDLDLQAFMTKDAYKSMPVAVKESVLDLAFNKGIGAISKNKVLLNALNQKDYVKVISNLTQDYSESINAKGQKVKKYASGLNKRRLYEMSNASRIYKKGLPNEILKSAKNVYIRGLNHLKQEKARGEYTDTEYQNILAEYKNLAYEWFDGKIGAKSKQLDVSKINDASKTQTTKKVDKASVASTSVVNVSANVKVNGKSTSWTVNALYDDWQKTAKRSLRSVKRPLPEIDSKGNIVALVKTLAPKGNGAFSGKTIIINPGHGGAMNKVEKNGKLNVNFDPGTSNAKMSPKNPNLETNKFIGNGGKDLEEWVVNQRISDVLVEKIRKAGGKVIYVQGSVYSAQNAIRDIQKKQKIHAIVSLHSNSQGDKRGIFVIGNKRNGIDKNDEKLGKFITDQMNKNSWFRGITTQTAQSLGVLSVSGSKTSSIPGVLIETGNLKNEKDVANLNSSAFKNYMVDAIFAGLKDCLK